MIIWRGGIIIACFTLLSGLFLFWLDETPTLEKAQGSDQQQPDSYMENFTVLEMQLNGKPQHRLKSGSQATYPNRDTTELTSPIFELFQEDSPPTVITADTGQVTSDNKIVLLYGNVHLRKPTAEGALKLEATTTEAKIFPDREYVETDKPTRLIGTSVIFDSIGMKAYLKENKLILENHVLTTAKSEKVY